jgi:CTP synthase
VNSEQLTSENVAAQLDGMAGVVICPGFGQRGIEGKIIAAEYTRTHDIPTFGICLGMQMMVIEFARNVLGYKDANSAEMNPDTPHNVIDIMEEQKNITQMGGTMRLGAYECELKEGSRAYEAYQDPCGKTARHTTISERHSHRYEFNNDYRDVLQEKGLCLSGISPDGKLVETVELSDRDFYIGVQYHPEFKSRPNRPHPLFKGFIAASLKVK